MSDSAEPGGGTPRSPAPRPGREPESASFETVRVAVRRTRPPFFVFGFLATVAALVVVGVGGQLPAGPASASPGAVDAASAGAAGPSALAPTPRLPFPGASGDPLPVGSPGVAQILTSGPGPIQIVARRYAQGIFVHGDVFVPRVTWVFVSLQDDEGRVAGWASVSVPGAAGPGVGNGPSLRFDVEVAVPDAYDGRLWIQANAYDANGERVASTRFPVPPDGQAPVAPVSLTSPGAWDEVIDARTVVVAGRLEVRADAVEIGLFTEDGQRLETLTLSTADRDGGIRPVRLPTFEVEFALPAQRPDGRIWVVIAALDEAGTQIGVLHRPVRIVDLAT